MLRIPIINKLIIALANVILLSLLGLLLLFLQRMYLFKDEIRTLDISEIYYGTFFFCLLIYLLYAFIFVVILFKFKIPLIVKAYTVAIGGVLLVYFIQYAFGGSSRPNMKIISSLLTFLLIGFILPYSQQKLEQMKRLKNP